MGVKMTPGGPLEGPGTLVFGSQTTLYRPLIDVRMVVKTIISPPPRTSMGGSHRPLPLRGDWQGPMTSLLDPRKP